VLLNLDLKRTDRTSSPTRSCSRTSFADSIECRRSSSARSTTRRCSDSAPSPRVATSAATGEAATFYFSMLEGVPSVPPVCAFQVPAVYGDVSVVDERFVETAHDAGIAVHVWTINDPGEMHQLLDVGLTG